MKLVFSKCLIISFIMELKIFALLNTSVHLIPDT